MTQSIENLKKLEALVRCLKCDASLGLQGEDAFVCTECGEVYPIVAGVPRFTESASVEKSDANDLNGQQTLKHFGFQWQYFDRWGFIEESEVPPGRSQEFFGGLTTNRRDAFDAKCRLDASELTADSIVLDGGCGNGRYTFEAAQRGQALVVGIDLASDAVEAAAKNTAQLENVVVIQGSLLDPPFKEDVFDAAFSNGVLMHTGDAPLAFSKLARSVKADAPFIVNVYNKLNPVFEFNDWLIRSFSTRLKTENAMRFSSVMARIARILCRGPRSYYYLNSILRIQPTVVHMFDWYTPRHATHHTWSEVQRWFRSAGFVVTDKPPAERLWFRLSAVNIRGVKQLAAKQ